MHQHVFKMTSRLTEQRCTQPGEKTPLPHRGTDPASAACRFDALPTELHPRPKGTSDTQRLATALVSVSGCGLVVRRLAGKQKDLGSIRFGSPFSSLQKLWFLDTVL